MEGRDMDPGMVGLAGLKVANDEGQSIRAQNYSYGVNVVSEAKPPTAATVEKSRCLLISNMFDNS